jgi:hypothetical protein
MKLRLACMVGVAALVMGGSASAAEYLVDLTGTYTTDGSGLAGTFDLSFLADTAMGTSDLSTTASYYTDSFSSATLQLSNYVRITVPTGPNTEETIASNTLTLPTSIESYIDIENSQPGAPAQFNTAYFESDTDGNGTFAGDGGSTAVRMNTYFHLAPPAGSLPGELAPVTYDIQPGDKAAGVLEIAYPSASGPTTDPLTTLLFTPETLTVSAVPEAGTWALMIIGLGGVGVALRQRRYRFRPLRS